MPSVDSLINAELEQLPFGFDVTVDQMAYMSCNGRFAAGHPNAFTLKAGAYSSGSGVRLKGNLISQLSAYNTDIQGRALEISERNREVGAVLSLRERNYLQNYYHPDTKKGEVALSRMMFNDDRGLYFSNEHYVKRMLTMGSGNYMNYISGLPGLVDKNFEGMLRFAENETFADGIRQMLSNSHYLTVTFPVPISDQAGSSKRHSLVRSPYNTASGDSRALTSVFGKGYVLSFQQHDSRMLTTPPRVMNVANTVNLENQSIEGETWDCSEKFVIVRPEDAKRVTYDPTPDRNLTDPERDGNYQVCEMEADAIPENNEQRRRWDRIRNVLPADSWFVTLPRTVTVDGQNYTKPGCVVPKTQDFCYDMQQETGGANNPNIRVAYYYEEDISGPAWGHTVEGIEYDGRCGPNTFFICPHYVTICYKR